ncbi:dihydroorotate oxidase B, electron transfer subunit [Hathewaya proteolytica DSM 3090]|uniref:Dihydroorotate dehydrogenase B (NAD(+)), electron transfer subunit n=1 Tax=Hathewaya proteolytica DSM 3090 TaxID=1121331 RepID=A0A1M6Q7R6_9CLOT|nr:dihydroorotate oxidase B, electron transfer subunit [Hathewaya proteolytica DSM 3090]
MKNLICSVEKVLSNENIIDNVYEIRIEGQFQSDSGQFYMLKPVKSGILFGRPISVYDVQPNYISFLYQVVGQGTKDMSEMVKGDEMQILGPLGNGFDLNEIKGKVALVAGGIGIAPMVNLAKALKGTNTIDFYAGFRDCVYAVDEVEKIVENIYVSTETGSKGHKGYITEILNPSDYDIVVSCGPLVMMKKVISMAKANKVPIIVSMENRMACGLGACLGCTCKTVKGNETVCKTGPIFRGEDLIFDEK